MNIRNGGIFDLRSRKEGGFTLVELLVVIAIIGILATLVLLQLGSARAKARDTQRITAVSQIRSAVEQYMDDNNGAVPAAAGWDGLCVVLKPAYVSSCPLLQDLSGMSYGYNSTINKFQVAADLEATTKPSAMNADADLPMAQFATGGVNGALEACTSAAADCYYDQGN